MRAARPAPFLAAAALALAGALAARAFARRAPGGPIPKLDVHEHVPPALIADALRLAETQGISGFVNLSGGHVGGSLEASLAAAARFPGRVVTFMNVDWSGCCDEAWGARESDAIAAGRRLGARGLKIFKGLGLAVEERGARLPVDSPRLDPIWEACARARIPVAIHTGDPKAFFEPMGPANERMEELAAAPEWSFADRAAFPSWEALFAEFVRLVERRRDVAFIGVHFGNDPEDPAEVGRLLDRLPNLSVDTAARVPELGRRAEAARAVILAHPDRVLFGTDVQWLGRPERRAVIYGAGDPAPPEDAAPLRRFFEGTFRFFETREGHIPSPTPIQGRWDVAGIGLPRPALEALYHQNAERLLGWALPADGAPQARPALETR